MMTSPAEVNLAQVSQLGDEILTQLDALRDSDPIHWDAGQKVWLVTGHAQVLEGLCGDLPLSVGGRLTRLLELVPVADRHRIPRLLALFPKMLITLDPPEQLRLRKLMMKAFGRPIAESYRPFVQDRAAQVLAAALGKGDVEFVEEVARPIAGSVILKLMGLPETYIERLKHWATTLSAGLSGGGVTPEMVLAAETVTAEMEAAFMAEIGRRRANPQEDFISALILAEDGGERLTDAEIVATCILILIAGHDTTTNTMTLGVRALAQEPGALARLRADEAGLADAVMELMRYVSMSTSQVRIVTRDFDWSGRRLRAGEVVYLFIASANRDPAVFEAPARLDFSRPQGQNLVFGPGLHHCIGHHLAKMQLAEVFAAVARQVGGIAPSPDPLEWGPQISFRGVKRLPVALSPA